MGIALASVLGAACGTLLLAALLAGSFAIVVSAFPTTTGAARSAATVTVGLWALVALFHLLAWAHLFRLELALLLLPVSWWLWRRGGTSVRAALEEQRADLRTLVNEIRGSAAAVLGIAALVLVIARLLRGLVAPPLGWDSLTYHLVKVARWIRTGGLQPEAAPDCWGAYEYFPYAGDVVWAWAMLPFRGDAPLAAAGILVVLACVLAAYALGRELGGDRTAALLAGLAFAFFPSCFNFATTGYVDNTVALCTILGLLFLCRVLRGADVREVILAAAALGCGVGTKAVAIPILGLGALVTAAALLRDDARGRRLSVALASTVAAAVALPGYVRAWLERGSPLYPLPLVVLGRTLVPGNVVTELVQGGRLAGVPPPFHLDRFLQDFLLPEPGAQSLNPGPGLVLLVAAGLAGALRLCLRRPRETVRVALVLAAAVVVIVGLSGPNTLGLRTYWAKVFGRFLLPSLACLAVLAAPLAGRLTRSVLALVVATGLWLAIPRGFSPADLVALSRFFGLVTVGLAAAVLLVRLGRSRGQPAAFAAAAGVVCVCTGAWGALRASSRYPIYRAAAARVAYDAHPLNASYASAWTLWEFFDTETGHRLAVSAGWNGVGDNWFRYPLYGSRLQNELVYVPPTTDGSVVDYLNPPELFARASRKAWLGRLIAARVDALVLLSPMPPLETRWVAELPEVFTAVARAADGRGAAFRIDAARARRVLETLARSGPPAAGEALTPSSAPR